LTVPLVRPPQAARTLDQCRYLKMPGLRVLEFLHERPYRFVEAA